MGNRINLMVRAYRTGLFRVIGAFLTLAMSAGAVWAEPQPVIGPPIRIDVGCTTFTANETTASASDANPLEIVAGWNDWRDSGGSEVIRSGFALSLDGGQSWTDFLVRPPGPNQTGVEGDPMTAADPRTGTLWAGAISGFFSGGPNSGIYVARKDPGAAEFAPAVMARTCQCTDKPWMAAGPRPGMPDTTRLYITYNEGVIWSDDMGDTWTYPTSLGSGLGFLPRVGPGGELYIAYWSTSGSGNYMNLKRSYNGGASFTTHTVAMRMDVWGAWETTRFPGLFRVPALLYLDVDQNTGTLYAAYFDTTNIVGGNYNVDIYFTKSIDDGDSWTTPVIANRDLFPPGDQFFCWLEVDEESRLHMVYFDSRHTVQDDDTVHGMLDAYYSFSIDGGARWTEHRLTPSSWDSDDDGLDRPGSQFIGDYLGLAFAGRRAYPVYLDTSNGDLDTYTNVILFPQSGDFDDDDDVDLDDYYAFHGCRTDPGDGVDPGCERADLDSDGDADMLDFLSFQVAFGS